MSNDLEALSHHLLSAATKAGAQAADVLALDGSSTSIEVLKGKLEHAERSEGVDFGLRVLVGNRQACVSSSDVRPDAIVAMAERAVAMARLAPSDEAVGLADPDQLATNLDAGWLDLLDKQDEISPAEMQDWAMRAEEAAMSVSGVAQVQSASAGTSRSRFHLAATNGFSAGYSRSGTHLSCVAISGEGLQMERDYYGEGRVHREDLPSPEEVGKLAGERAASRFGARKPPTGSYPILYDERVSAGIIGHLLGAINGTAIVRGASWLRDKRGELVLPEGMTVTEDPHRARVGNSRPFDSDGLEAKKRDIVLNGVLQGWTLDLMTARKLGLESTASATRGVSSPPSPSLSNISVSQGSQSQQELIAQMGTGLMVTSLIGSSINATTGDYSRGASGFWIENGEISYPVNECTIAGNLLDFLPRIIAANDAQNHKSSRVPSLLIEGLTIAGS
jgi:PmbA protein